MLEPYCSLREISHREVRDIFEDEVVVEEKVEGSQFSFQVVGDEVFMTSRRQPVIGGGQWVRAMEAVEKVRYNLVDGWIYRGEYLQSPRHNRIRYDRTPINNIVIFDIETSPNEFLSVTEKQEETERIGFECVPVLYEGKLESAQQLRDLLDTKSFLGENVKIEGVVVKNYNKRLNDHLMVAKFVSEEFQEVMQIKHRHSKPKASFVDELIEELKTEARWAKAVQHLREEGVVNGTPQDIGKLVKEVQADIYLECEEYIREFLFEKAKKDIQKGVVNGFGEWYKGLLVEEMEEELGE
jgi:hypothetical protein